jgi:PAS domain S-box-containing protein
MEHLAAGLLQRSSDAIAIIRLDDEMVIDVNEAFFAMTGFSREEVVGRSSREFAIWLDPATHSVVSRSLRNFGSIGNVLAAFHTRSGELRVGELSALALDAGGQQDAVCTIRNSRDPTKGERRRAAREELLRAVRGKGPWPVTAATALRALGQCLRWDLAALWSVDNGGGRLHCTALWQGSLVDLRASGEARQRTALPPPAKLPLHVLEEGRAIWIPDVLEHPGLPRFTAFSRSVHGWLGFPAIAGGRIVGVVEFYSREVRQPDDDLLIMTGEFGRLFGWLVRRSRRPTVAAGREANRPPARPAVTGPPQPEGPDAVPNRDRPRDLAAAATANGARPAQDAGPGQVDPPELLQELAARVDKLNSLLEDIAAGDPGTPAPTGSPPRVPTGLTLKAVSARTGIPAATLRTWEHRYSFTRPARSQSGYRLYGEDDIARILQVKSLLRQGVRISAAVATVMEPAERSDPEPTGPDPSGPPPPRPATGGRPVPRLPSTDGGTTDLARYRGSSSNAGTAGRYRRSAADAGEAGSSWVAPPSGDAGS